MADTCPSVTESSPWHEPGRSLVARLAFILIVLSALSSGIYFARESGTDAEVYSNDFNVFYHAAREVLAGRDPYAHSLGEWTPYVYPPLLAELIVPLALLPLPVAAYFWFLINAASLVIAAWLAATLASESKERDFAALEPHAAESSGAALAACAVAVGLRFALDSFNLGQVNALVAALAVAHLYLYARGRRVSSAVALVVAVSIKLTPALLLVYHIAKLRLRFVVACGVLLAAVTAMSFLPFGASGADAFQVFVSRTVKNQQGYDLAYAGNQSLRGAVARLSALANREGDSGEGESRRPTDGATLMISIALLAGATFSAARARSELAAAAPFFCLMVLLSPLSWKAHFVVLVIPIAQLLARMQSSGRLRYWIAGTLVAAFALFNLTSPRVIGNAAAEWSDAHSLVFAGALLIFISSVATAATCKFGNQSIVCYSDQSRTSEKS